MTNTYETYRIHTVAMRNIPQVPFTLIVMPGQTVEYQVSLRLSPHESVVSIEKVNDERTR